MKYYNNRIDQQNFVFIEFDIFDSGSLVRPLMFVAAAVAAVLVLAILIGKQ